MKISLCITTYNEEKYIDRLLDSIALQTKQPDEVIIVDGGSIDNTLSIISNFQLPISNKQIKIVTKKGNRPFGRNESIKAATGDIIAITDAGCELDKHWLAEITKPFADEKVAVVSGYYAGKPQNWLQACLVPYVLVMPDKINPTRFLPSTRSMAMRKSTWEELGGFPQEYRWNEDYVFAKMLEQKHIAISFAKKAIVYWFPRETVLDGYKMFYAFAKGDTQAGIWRKKVIFLLFRVSAFFLLCLLLPVSPWAFPLVFGLVIFYWFWAVWKNYRYVKNMVAFVYLPLWQLVSDIAVFFGSVIGFLDRIRHRFS